MTQPDRNESFWLRLYRRFLVLYPRHTRGRFRKDREELFADLLRSARSTGRGAVLALVVKTLLEIPISAFREHRRARRDAGRGTGPRYLDEFRLDFGQAVRSLRRSPVFALTVVGTLAIGIGANIATFTVVSSVLLRPLPYPDSDRLTVLWNQLGRTQTDRVGISFGAVPEIAEQTTTLEAVAAAWSTASNLTGERPDRVTMTFTTPNFFELMGIEPSLGRRFDPEDSPRIDRARLRDPAFRPPRVPVIISFELWQRRFGGLEDVVGVTAELNGQEVEIIGVTPPRLRLHLPSDARLPERTDVWALIPIDFAGDRSGHSLTVLGKLEDEATLRELRAEVDRIAAWQRSRHEYDRRVDLQIVANSLHSDVVDGVERPLMLLWAAVVLVLLIACGNVANLFLVRASSKRREVAVRAALGGGRSRIVRQMLTESLLVALLGGAGGVLVAHWGVGLLVMLRPDHLPLVDVIGFDWRVAGFAIGTSILAALLFGTVPAVYASRVDLADSLRQRETANSGIGRVRGLLVVTEVAFSLMLLVGAGLMLRTFVSLHRIDPGFNAEGVVTADVALPFFAYLDRRSRVDFFNNLSRRLAADSRIDRVGGASAVPLAPDVDDFTTPYATTSEPGFNDIRETAAVHAVLPGFLESIGAKLTQGRTFTSVDNTVDAPPRIVIDAALARMLWPLESAVGRTLFIRHFNDDLASHSIAPAEIIGVVAPIRYSGLRGMGGPTIFAPHQMYSWAEVTLTLRTSADSAETADLISGAIASIDPQIPVPGITSMGEYVDRALAPETFLLAMTGIFAIVALVLSAVGLYGVISFVVRDRTGEIGVRLAFGAGPTVILRMLLAHGITITLVGVTIGILGAVAVSSALQGFVYGVEPTDPLTFVVITSIIVFVAVLASVFPALRASKTDPARTLRGE